MVVLIATQGVIPGGLLLMLRVAATVVACGTGVAAPKAMGVAIATNDP